MTTATTDLLATTATLPLLAAAAIAVAVIVVALRDDARADGDPEHDGANSEFAELLARWRYVGAYGHDHAPGRMSARRILRGLGRRPRRGEGGRHRLERAIGSSAQRRVVWA